MGWSTYGLSWALIKLNTTVIKFNLARNGRPGHHSLCFESGHTVLSPPNVNAYIHTTTNCRQQTTAKAQFIININRLNTSCAKDGTITRAAFPQQWLGNRALHRQLSTRQNSPPDKSGAAVASMEDGGGGGGGVGGRGECTAKLLRQYSHRGLCNGQSIHLAGSISRLGLVGKALGW